MTKNLKFLFSIFSIALISVSCTEEKEKPDFVEEAAGTYTYTQKMYILNGTTLEYLGTEFDESGTAVLEKTANGFKLQAGEAPLISSTIADVGNGFTFEIEPFTLNVDGYLLVMKGYDGVTLGNANHHGSYQLFDKKITAYFMIDKVLEDGQELEIVEFVVFELVATKT